MGFSKKFIGFLSKVFKKTPDTAEETVTIHAQRDSSSEIDDTIAETRVRFPKPVDIAVAAIRVKELAKQITNSASNRALDINKLIMAGLAGEKVPGERITQQISLSVPSEEPKDKEPKNTLYGKIQLKNGKYVSPSNLAGLLEKAAIEETSKYMKEPTAPLKFRTGRFANSLNISRINILNGDSDSPTLDVRYGYMERPYSVFDPSVSTYRGLSLRPRRGARNPNRIIPMAIGRARKKLINPRYNVLAKKG